MPQDQGSCQLMNSVTPLGTLAKAAAWVFCFPEQMHHYSAKGLWLMREREKVVPILFANNAHHIYYFPPAMDRSNYVQYIQHVDKWYIILNAVEQFLF